MEIIQTNSPSHSTSHLSKWIDASKRPGVRFGREQNTFPGAGGVAGNYRPGSPYFGREWVETLPRRRESRSFPDRCVYAVLQKHNIFREPLLYNNFSQAYPAIC